MKCSQVAFCKRMAMFTYVSDIQDTHSYALVAGVTAFAQTAAKLVVTAWG